MSAGGVLWHDLECGAYQADLAVWEGLAEAAEAPTLDLGCGTGRVALHLARLGHRVTGIDLDPGLVAAFNDRADGLPAEALIADAREFDLGAEFGLALAPMQLVQLFEGPEERFRFLGCVARHLRRGGLAGLAIVERLPAPTDWPPPLPDAREVEGWVHSSLPLETAVDGEQIVVRRLRQSVSPDGGLSEDVDEVALSALPASLLESEAERAGFRPGGRHEIAATEEHVGSTVVALQRGS